MICGGESEQINVELYRILTFVFTEGQEEASHMSKERRSGQQTNKIRKSGGREGNKYKIQTKLHRISYIHHEKPL